MTNYLCQIEGDEQTTIRAESADQAARRYVRGGDWTEERDGWPGYGTLTVMVWHADENGEATTPAPEFVAVDVVNHRAVAEQRLANLGLSSDLIDDESGQTSEHEHLSWLATAPADDITRWANDMARDVE